MSIGKLHEFNVSNGAWSSYMDRVEMYYKVNVVEEAMKVPVLIAAMGDEAYELLENLASPTKPAELTLAEINDLMAQHLQPAPSVLAERYRFRQRRQNVGETVSMYVAELKRLSKHCKFASNLSEGLRDQFVCGLSSDVIRQRLFAEDDKVTFTAAVKLATSLEAAERDAAIVEQAQATGSRGTGEVQTVMFANRGKSSSTFGGSQARAPVFTSQRRGSNGRKERHCEACGAHSHNYVNCKFRDYVCSKCQRTGHLRRVCPDWGAGAGAAGRGGARAPARRGGPTAAAPARSAMYYGDADRGSSEEHGGDIEEELHHLCLNNYQSILPILLLFVVSRSKCESSTGYNYKSSKGGAFGELLKPPPPPLSHIQPVPFHGGASRSQRQNIDSGYHYQPPPPPPPPQAPTSDFKFPAPFYKQYNFNFVPPPQPFTTPSSSLFQKVSSWLFPSQETGYDSASAYNNNNNIAPVKKDCNPCNLVPWIPVIRYDLGAKGLQQSLIPTYGPPSPTAQNVVQFRPRPFYSQNQEVQHISTGHASYGPPSLGNNNGFASSTYGPPSPTHTVAIPTSSTFVPSSSFPIQSSSYGSSSTSLGHISSSYNSVSTSYGAPGSTYGQPGSSYDIPSSTYGAPSSSYGLPSSAYGVPSSTYGPPTSTYTTPAPLYDSPRPLSSTYLPATPSYQPGDINNDLPQDNQVDIIQNILPAEEFELPKVSAPFGFKNSYGDPIPSSYGADVLFPVSATAAESSKIRTEVLPLDGTKGLSVNHSLALGKPAPFSLNRGRNIHTLQPVALPNLSVSPLPPIFNARPFRPLPNMPLNHALGLNNVQHTTNNVNIQQSFPIAEYTHSIDYPASIVQSPIIDIDVGKATNKSKGYRNIPNGYIVDSIRDISSQASEDHIEATKSNQDSSFESTGAEVGNDLYEPGIPADLKYNSGNRLSNHKNNFADLRGVKDEDVDKYRTESNLQNIDSPLLYLKPGTPHKEYTNFVFSTNSPLNVDDYEIYDDISTTVAPKPSTFPSSAWDESRSDYSDAFSQATAAQEDSHKPKIVQIIIPYTTGQQNKLKTENEDNQEEWISTPEDDYQARKVPTNTENYYIVDSSTESYNTVSTTTEEPINTEQDIYESERFNTHSILNDLYDVREPPFDIIKLQHNIDDWTEQEFSKRFRAQSQRTRANGKYAKQIPDEYFTTNSPVTNDVTPSTFNYDFFDHEGSSSIRHSVTDNEVTNTKLHKEYNDIEMTKTKLKEYKKEDDDELQKLHIYTAASSFRTSTTTPAPWGKIQTSISPLTKEKVYVVTSKPWTESQNTTVNDYESFESKKTSIDNEASASDSLPFQSPRFSNRPSFPTGEKVESVKSDSSYGFPRNWHQRINDLENQKKNSTSFPEGSQNISTNKKEDTHPTTVTAEPPENVSSEKSVTQKSNSE